MDHAGLRFLNVAVAAANKAAAPAGPATAMASDAAPGWKASEKAASMKTGVNAMASARPVSVPARRDMRETTAAVMTQATTAEQATATSMMASNEMRVMGNCATARAIRQRLSA